MDYSEHHHRHGANQGVRASPVVLVVVVVVVDQRVMRHQKNDHLEHEAPKTQVVEIISKYIYIIY